MAGLGEGGQDAAHKAAERNTELTVETRRKCLGFPRLVPWGKALFAWRQLLFKACRSNIQIIHRRLGVRIQIQSWNNRDKPVGYRYNLDKWQCLHSGSKNQQPKNKVGETEFDSSSCIKDVGGDFHIYRIGSYDSIDLGTPSNIADHNPYMPCHRVQILFLSSHKYYTGGPPWVPKAS